VNDDLHLEGPYDQHAQVRKITRARTEDGRPYTGILCTGRAGWVYAYDHDASVMDDETLIGKRVLVQYREDAEHVLATLRGEKGPPRPRTFAYMFVFGDEREFKTGEPRWRKSKGPYGRALRQLEAHEQRVAGEDPDVIPLHGRPPPSD
jgi:hypothetical protein